MQTYCDQDLADTLAGWNDLVQVVEDRMPAHGIDRVSGISHGLYNAQDLLTAGLNPDRFASKLFSQARRPRCRHLGPRLRLPTAYELTTSPTKSLKTNEHPNSPICILRGDKTARSQFHGVNHILWG